jgi:hypothetical protein
MPITYPDPITFKHKNASHFQYEKISSPWHGPIKRARQALLSSSIEPFTPDDYLDFILKNHPKIYACLEWVQFYRFLPGQRFSSNLRDDFEYRLAVTYLKPEPDARYALFMSGEVITNRTGWYPLVMGSKALLTIPAKYFSRETNVQERSIGPEDVEIGEIKQIRDVSGTLGGTAVLLIGTNGELLFDTGFNVFTDELDDLKAVCISHFHKDHSGGIWEIFDEHDFPLYLSEPTLRYLWQKKDKDPAARKRLLQSSRLVENEVNRPTMHNGLNFFPVFHAPGSYGFIYKDPFGKCMIYPGDLCLKNGFLDQRETIYQTINNIPVPQKWVMVDAVMLQSSDRDISTEDQPPVVIQDVITAVQKRNVTFISQSPETLIYSLILTYLSTQKKQETRNIKLVLNNTLYEVCQSLLGPMLFHDYTHIDPFVYSVMKKAVKNFVESFRVYPISAISRLSEEEKIIIFVTPPDITISHEIQNRIRKGDVVLAGAMAMRSDIPPEINNLFPRSILRISSTVWSFHSSKEDLLDLIKRFTEVGTHSILFHCDPKEANAFISANGLDKRFVQVHTAQGTLLG